jgi:hypothetical protein
MVGERKVTRSVRRGVKPGVVAAVFGCTVWASLLPESATADSSTALSATRDPARFLLFSGADLWRNGGSLHLGALWSPGGVNHDGFTLKVLLAQGRYLYRAGVNDIRGTHAAVSVLPGWKFTRDRLHLTVFAGLDAQQHRLAPDDPGNGLRGSHLGLRAGADLWWEPAAQMMATASVSGSTIGANGWMRGALGWRIADRFWAGPELEASGDRVYQQYRAGLHVTGVKTGAFEWSAGTGYVADSTQRAGLYGRLGLLTRR